MPSVESYLEVKVIYHALRTHTKSTNTDTGSSPKWNEVLEFPLWSENEK